MSRLNVEKAIQAAGVLLRRSGKQMSRIRLIKLLYMADREAVRKYGMPILGSRIAAMKHGPVHTEVLDLIRGEHVEEPEWSRYFRNKGYRVFLSKEPQVGALSKHEIDVLNDVCGEMEPNDDWSVVDHTHKFDEWQKHYPNPQENTSRVIPFEDVVEAVGRASDRDSILQDVADKEAFESFFAEATS
jgi:uncharacterized phage-associated protein